MTRHNPRRRLFLRSVSGAVGGSLALPHLPSLASEAPSVGVAAGAGTGARRFVAIGNLLGFQRNHLFPKASDDGLLGQPLLEPLAGIRDHVDLIRGLDHGLKGGHFAVHTFLSGVLHHESKHRRDGNITVDQFIADHVGRQTRFTSLTVGSEGGIHGGCQMAWTRSGVRVPPITGPAALFERLFVSDSAESLQRRARAGRLQASILDRNREEAADLQRRINADDRDKLDQYMTSIRDVEQRLAARTRWMDRPKPEPPFDKPADTNTVDDLPLLYELIALALQTDSTRVATLEIGGSFLPHHLGIDKSYHGLSHHGKDPESVADLIKLETYQLEHFAKFVARLAATPDGETTLLDNTAVLFGSGMGDGNKHTNNDLPIMLAGGGYGRGRYRDVRGEGPGKIPLCNLLLDIANRTGVEADAFGTSTGTFA